MKNDSKKCTLILFGGTGDLAIRKLLPALFHLWRKGHTRNVPILAVGRRLSDVDAYRKFLFEEVDEAQKYSQAWHEFAQLIEYHRGDINTREDFDKLHERLRRVESEHNTSGSRLFYYAVGPSFFGPVTDQLASAEMIWRASASINRPWTRIVVEKPFGKDRASARELDRDLLKHLDESQIFRIDHYLGKETVQNLIAFRFANGLFEPVWNYKYISSVQLTVAESVGVEGRGDYYESAGALRDMMQNHMLQLLALVAMEPPISLEADAIRDEKVKLLKSLRPIPNGDEAGELTVRGQYGPGKIGTERVIGYREEPSVDPNSITPTYVAVKTYVDNWRWANVPFCLRHGKRLPKRGTEIAIQFNTPPLSLFRGTGVFEQCTNTLVLRIQPNEGITLYFGAKTPGAGMKLTNVKMEFFYEEEFHQQIPEAYERLLLDAFIGDPTLFTRSDEVDTMWRWADAMLTAWERLPAPKFPNYAAGTWGPVEAEDLLPRGNEHAAGLCPIGWRRW